jgi:4'-phosphopantetheinyl transferase, N-terminal
MDAHTMGWPALDGGAIQVRIADLDVSAEAIESACGLLSPDERARAARLVFARDRDRFTAARAFLRRLLGEILGVPPARIEFVYGARGKPALAPGLAEGGCASTSRIPTVARWRRGRVGGTSGPTSSACVPCATAGRSLSGSSPNRSGRRSSRSTARRGTTYSSGAGRGRRRSSRRSGRAEPPPDVVHRPRRRRRDHRIRARSGRRGGIGEMGAHRRRRGRRLGGRGGRRTMTR